MSPGAYFRNFTVFLDAIKFVLVKYLYSYRDELPEKLGKIAAQLCNSANFRLTCIAQKRPCLSSLICIKENVCDVASKGMI